MRTGCSQITLYVHRLDSLTQRCIDGEICHVSTLESEDELLAIQLTEFWIILRVNVATIQITI